MSERSARTSQLSERSERTSQLSERSERTGQLSEHSERTSQLSERGERIGQVNAAVHHAGQLRALSAQATELARELPGALRRIAVRVADHSIEVEWCPPPRPAAGPPAIGDAAVGGTAGGDSTSGDSTAEDDTYLVRAPLVGTFYTAPEPGAEPFVAVGDPVEPGQPLAIVEAMKLMNRLHAEVAGRVAEVLVADGQPVEFDQPLMRLSTSPTERSAGASSGGDR
jgi:acetyl-CoA carboxylase biotin carboxyl carrier protein